MVGKGRNSAMSFAVQFVRYGLIGCGIGFLLALTSLDVPTPFFLSEWIADIEARASTGVGHLGYLVGFVGRYVYFMLCGAVIGALFGVWRADRRDRKLKGIKNSSARLRSTD